MPPAASRESPAAAAAASAPATVGFLGPPGTFGEQALRSQEDLAALELVALPSMAEVLFAVDAAELDVGFVAVENAIEGTVNVTVDTLAFDVDVLIQREVEIPVRMNALGLVGSSLDRVREVVSIPVATAQCRGWLREHLPGGVAHRQVDSTAEAARQVAEAGDPTVVAIANSLAAERYGLDVLAAGIEDHPDNATRFVAVARARVPAPTGHDKTTVVIFQHADRPGSLLGILQEFAARSINLTKLESRPTKRRLGQYCFLVDFEGHVADEVVADCLRRLHAEQAGVKFLGSYPAAGDQGPARRRDATDARRAAERWLTDVRDLIQP